MAIQFLLPNDLKCIAGLFCEKESTDYGEKKRPVTTNIRTRFGKHVFKLRTEKGYSQENTCGVSRYALDISGWDRARERNPTLINIEKLARALEISLYDLFIFDVKR